MEAFIQMMLNRQREAAERGEGGLDLPSADEDLVPEKVVQSFDLEGIANYIKEGKAKNIIVMAGAGRFARVTDSTIVGLWQWSCRSLPFPRGFIIRNPRPFLPRLPSSNYPGIHCRDLCCGRHSRLPHSRYRPLRQPAEVQPTRGDDDDSSLTTLLAFALCAHLHNVVNVSLKWLPSLPADSGI